MEGVEVLEQPEGRFNQQQALVDQGKEAANPRSGLGGKEGAFPD